MSYDLSTLREEVKFNLQSHPRFTDAVVDRAINKGLEEMAKFTRYLEDFWYTDSVDGQFEYNLTMIPLEVQTVTFDNGRPLTPLTLQEWANTRFDDVNQIKSDPSKFIVRNNTILGLWPIPDRAARITAILTPMPTELVLPGDVPSLPAACRDSVVLFASYYCLRAWPKEEERSKFFYDLYKEQRSLDKMTLRINTVIKTQHNARK